MKKNCQETNIPSVNEDAIECCDLTPTNCVVTSKAFPCFQVGKGVTLTKLMDAVCQKISDAEFDAETPIVYSVVAGDNMTVQTNTVVGEVTYVISADVVDTKSVVEAGSNVSITENVVGDTTTYTINVDAPMEYEVVAGDNVSVTESVVGNLTTYIINSTTLGSQDTPIEVTYAQARALMSSSSLEEAKWYKITDFATIYDQPDYSGATTPKTTVVTKTAAVDPIMLLAISATEFAKEVWRPSTPRHTLEYDINFSQTEVMGVTTKGRITYCKDEFNNETHYDHTVVLMKRYESVSGSGIFNSIWDTGFGSTEVLTFGSNCNNNKIGDSGFNIGENDFIIGNNVIGDGSYNNTFGNTIMNNTLGTGNYNNFFNDDIRRNTIGDNSNNNTFESEIVNNYIGHTDSTYYGSSFRQNLIEQSSRNRLSTSCSGNTITGQFADNVIGVGFDYNTIAGGFGRNIIGYTFSGNNIGTGFQSNMILDYFSNNTIGDYVASNNIGNYFGGNTIVDSFKYNDIKAEVSGTDFSTASYVYATHSCSIIKTSVGALKLSYIDGSGILQIVDPTD